MIKNILEQQSFVFEELTSSFKRQLDQQLDETSRREVKDVLHQVSYDRTIETLRRRWKALDEDAERVEKSVSLCQFRFVWSVRIHANKYLVTA